MQADLNPLFNWNVKQLFLYLTAEYETPNNKLNQVLNWICNISFRTFSEGDDCPRCHLLSRVCYSNGPCGLIV